jgi:hypothetical protein
MTTLAFAAMLPVVLAQAQEPSLIGSWRTTHPPGPDGPAYAYTETYSPDGGYFAEMAVASGPGGRGAGVVRTRGRFRMQGPTTVWVAFDGSVMCAAGSPCVPAPPGFGEPAGTSRTFTFQFQGYNRVIAENGTVLFRVE